MYVSHNMKIIIGVIILILLIVALAAVIAFTNTNNDGGDCENNSNGCPFTDDSMLESMSDCRNQTSTSDFHNDCGKSFPDHKPPKGFGRKHK